MPKSNDNQNEQKSAEPQSECERLVDSFDQSITIIKNSVFVRNDPGARTFLRALEQLKSSIRRRYSGSMATEAEKKNIEDFVRKFNEATAAVMNVGNIGIDQAQEAIDAAIEAAAKCQPIEDQVNNNVISPAAYVLGGLTGFLLGIPLGAVGGVGLLIVGVIYGFLDGQFLPSSLLFWKVAFVGSALVGAMYGAYWGATNLAQRAQSAWDDLYNYLNPNKSIYETAQPIFSNGLFFKNDAWKQRKEIAKEARLPAVIVDEVLSFVGRGQIKF